MIYRSSSKIWRVSRISIIIYYTWKTK